MALRRSFIPLVTALDTRSNMKIFRLVAVASAAFFIASSARAQNAGTDTAHAFLIGKGSGIQGHTSLLCVSTAIAIGQTAADPACFSLSGDVTMDASGVVTIGTAKVTIAKGGTGQSTQQAGFEALAPTPTRAGDLIYWNGTHYVTVAGNNSGTQVLQENASGVPSWATVAGTGTVTNVATAGLATGGPITTTGTVTVTAAVKADQTTGTSNAVAVTPGVQQFHDSAVKAWCGFNGATTGTNACANGSYNVTSVTRNSTGDYTLNFTTAFASAAYVCNVTTGTSASVGTAGENYLGTLAAGTAEVITRNTAAVQTDPAAVYVACYGRQ